MCRVPVRLQVDIVFSMYVLVLHAELGHQHKLRRHSIAKYKEEIIPNPQCAMYYSTTLVNHEPTSYMLRLLPLSIKCP